MENYNLMVDYCDRSFSDLGYNKGDHNFADLDYNRGWSTYDELE